jgi:hypothetical protein
MAAFLPCVAADDRASLQHVLVDRLRAAGLQCSSHFSLGSTVVGMELVSSGFASPVPLIRVCFLPFDAGKLSDSSPSIV